MPSYTILRVEEPDWDAVPAVHLRHTGWLPSCPIAAQAQACHDGEHLFLRLQASEQKIRATQTDLLAQVCNDSCLEFFFAPSIKDKRYFNFECNPLGALYLGFGAERSSRVRQIVNDPAIFQIHPYYTDDGWGVTLTIPADFIRIYFPDFAFSGEMAGNFYKCGDETEIPHYLAWSTLTCSMPDFHRREDFGSLLFL